VQRHATPTKKLTHYRAPQLNDVDYALRANHGYSTKRKNLSSRSRLHEGRNDPALVLIHACLRKNFIVKTPLKWG
jgi:hypothetical protein